MQKSSKKLVIASLLFAFFLISFGYAEPEPVTEKVSAFPQTMLYPTVFKSEDLLTWDNIKSELSHRIKFVLGKRSIRPYIICHKYQRLISRATDRYAKNSGELPFSVIDNKLLFSKNSDFRKVISNPPSLRNTVCSYHSFGDINKGCVIYCDAHGVDYESEFYKKHKKELEISRPLIIASDIAELIFFSPTLVFPLLAFFLIRRQRKSSTLFG